jgi:3-hydroxyisobutyrate dehydrogenase-like beta-hydroxyacid dehydrogenase
VGAEPRRWLVVGHGSVGSFVTRRLHAHGIAATVLDPAPRLPVEPPHSHLPPVAVEGPLDCVVSCVRPEAAIEVPALLDGLLGTDTLLFDWNTVSPADKRAIRDAAPLTTMVDVALLDSLDGQIEHPNLAISGERAGEAAGLLVAQGYNVVVVGDEVGEAARLKYLRSVFMKGLEALVLEYAALASSHDVDGVVRASIEGSLGPRFGSFMDLLVETDRVHADRRGRELASAVDTFAADGVLLRLAPAAAAAIQDAALAWEKESAPPAGAPAEELARHLRRTVWQPAST